MWRIESSAKKSNFHGIIIQYFVQIFNKNFQIGNNCCMAKFFDVFLSSIAIFFVTFCWSYYILHDGKTALFGAIIVGVCASYIVYQIVDKSQSRANATKSRKQKLAAFASYLAFCENMAEIVANLLKYYSFGVQNVQNDGIIATKEDVRYYVGLLLDNDFVALTELRKVVRRAKQVKADKLIVFCLGVKPTDIQLANTQLATKFVDAQAAYTLFEQADKLPTLDKPSFKKSAYFAQFAFSKKRFGGYFASGMFLLVTSALTFFPIYSIVWGTVLLGVALYSLLNKRYNLVQKVATLE